MRPELIIDLHTYFNFIIALKIQKFGKVKDSLKDVLKLSIYILHRAIED